MGSTMTEAAGGAVLSIRCFAQSNTILNLDFSQGIVEGRYGVKIDEPSLFSQDDDHNAACN